MARKAHKWEPAKLSEDAGQEIKKQESKWNKPCKVVLVILLVALCFVIGVIVGFCLPTKEDDQNSTNNFDATEMYKKLCKGDELGVEVLEEMHNVFPGSLAQKKSVVDNFIDSYSALQVVSNSVNDDEVIEAIVDAFQKTLFGSSLEMQYFNAMLSFSEKTQPNIFRILSNQSVIYEKQLRSHGGQLHPYIAYSEYGTSKGRLVYMNQGLEEDFQAAENMMIKLEGKVALVQHNIGSLLQKVKLAEAHGIVALLVFTPPVSHESANWMASPMCSDVAPILNLNEEGGDPASQGFPSLDGMPSKRPSEFGFPTIVAQTISCQDAKDLILKMFKLEQTETDDYIGHIQVSHVDLTVEVTTYNYLEEQTITNIIATVPGGSSADQLVILGANRNSFLVGEDSGVGGTASLLALMTALAEFSVSPDPPLWTPRRTIKVISWGGGDFGNIGIHEYLESQVEALRGRVVAYIDLDEVVLPRQEEAVIVTASLAFNTLLYTLTNKVPSPIHEGSTVYDDWLFPSPEDYPIIGTPCNYGNITQWKCNPWIDTLGTNYIRIKYQDLASPLPGLSAKDTSLSCVGRLALSLADASILQVSLNQSLYEMIIQPLQTLNLNLASSVFRDAVDDTVYDISVGVEELLSYITSVLKYDNYSQMRKVNECILDTVTAFSRTHTTISHLRTVESQTDMSSKKGVREYQLHLASLLQNLNSALMILKRNM